jgi:hypothetical protein
MKNTYNPNNSYETKKHELLIALGFEKRISLGVETLQYKHELLPEFDYDFTANSIEGIVKNIWQAGYERGKKDKLNQIKEVLEIKE